MKRTLPGRPVLPAPPARTRRFLPAPFLVAGAIAAAGAVGGAARAAAPPVEAAGWDAGTCGALTVTGDGSGSAMHRRITGFSARLARPGDPGDVVARLHADELRTVGPASLDGLPALFAGGALIGLEQDRPHGCDLTHAFRQAAITLASLPRGASAEQRWTGVRSSAGENSGAMATLRLRMENQGPDDLTRVTEDATGVSMGGGAGGDGHDAPLSMTLKVSAPRARLDAIAKGGALLPTDVVTIEDLTLRTGDALIEASGTVHPATRSGKMVLHAQDMEALKDSLPENERMKLGAGMLVMRLAADRDPDGSLRWNVVWQDNLVTINGVPLPTSF